MTNISQSRDSRRFFVSFLLLLLPFVAVRGGQATSGEETISISGASDSKGQPVDALLEAIINDSYKEDTNNEMEDLIKDKNRLDSLKSDGRFSERQGKRMDSMLYGSRLGKRMDSMLYGSRLGKRMDSMLYGSRLGKRMDSMLYGSRLGKRMDSMLYGSRLGKRMDSMLYGSRLGKRMDSMLYGSRLGKRMDSMLYGSRLGKRMDSMLYGSRLGKRMDSMLYGSRLGKRSQPSQNDKRAVDSLRFSGQLRKRNIEGAVEGHSAALM